MTVLEMVAVVAAGPAAGAIDAVVGSGTLVTSPELLAIVVLGVPAIVVPVRR
jgi:hypothetical protein